MANGLASIFEFRDYRKFIAAYVEYRKKSGQYSLARFSAEVGFESHNYGSLIVSGKRNLSSEDACALGRLLKMTEIERRYFFLLVRHNDCGDPGEKSFYLAWLKDLKPSAAVATLKPVDAPHLLSEWYMPAILACLHPMVACCPEKVGELAGLPSKSAERALKALAQEGLAVSTEKGFLSGGAAMLEARYGTHFKFHDFQRAQMERSLRVLKKSPKNGAKFSANTFLLNAETRTALTNQIRALIHSVDTNQAPEEGAELVQLNLQIFDVRTGC